MPQPLCTTRIPSRRVEPNPVLSCDIAPPLRARGTPLSLLVRSLRPMGPAEMLSAVERDHLPGHRRRRQDEAQCGGDFGGAGPALQRHGAILAGKLLDALPWARQRRAGADRIDP